MRPICSASRDSAPSRACLRASIRARPVCRAGFALAWRARSMRRASRPTRCSTRSTARCSLVTRRRSSGRSGNCRPVGFGWTRNDRSRTARSVARWPRTSRTRSACRVGPGRGVLETPSRRPAGELTAARTVARGGGSGRRHDASRSAPWSVGAGWRWRRRGDALPRRRREHAVEREQEQEDERRQEHVDGMRPQDEWRLGPWAAMLVLGVAVRHHPAVAPPED